MVANRRDASIPGLPGPRCDPGVASGREAEIEPGDEVASSSGLVALSRRLTGELRALDRHELRQVLILVGGLLQAFGDDAGTSDRVANAVTYRLEAVRCGKPGCGSCPHGPYWYAYYREGNRLRSRYVGRNLPKAVDELAEGDLPE